LGVASAGVPAKVGSPSVHLWEVDSGRLIRTLTGPQGGVWQNLRFAADSRFIAAVFFVFPTLQKGSWLVSRWEVASGLEALSISGNGANLQAGMPWVIDQGGNGTLRRVRVFDFFGSTPMLEVPLSSHEGPLLAADGRTLAIDSLSGNPVAEWLAAHGVTVSWGREEYSRIRFLDGLTGREIGRLPPIPIPKGDTTATWAQFSLDGSLFAVNDGATLRIWDIPPRKPLTWFAVGATLLALPMALVARWRVRRQPVHDTP
jgi:WD40 repeat protein